MQRGQNRGSANASAQSRRTESSWTTDLIVEGASSQHIDSIHSLCGSDGLSCRFAQLLQRLILEVSICQLEQTVSTAIGHSAGHLLQSRDSQLEALWRSEHALPLLVLPAIHAHSRQIIRIVANRQCISDLTGQS